MEKKQGVTVKVPSFKKRSSLLSSFKQIFFKSKRNNLLSTSSRAITHSEGDHRPSLNTTQIAAQIGRKNNPTAKSSDDSVQEKESSSQVVDNNTHQNVSIDDDDVYEDMLDDEEQKEEQQSPTSWTAATSVKSTQQTSKYVKRRRPHMSAQLNQKRGKGSILVRCTERNIMLLVNVYTFLDIKAPARFAKIGRVWVYAARKFYENFADFPRPHQYLLNQVLRSQNSIIARKIFLMLSFKERVSACCTCKDFYQWSNHFPLELRSPAQAKTFLQISHKRIRQRYKDIEGLDLEDIDAIEAQVLAELMARESFPHLYTFRMRRIRRVSSVCSFFPALMNTLFGDFVSSRLQILDLAQNDFQDSHFRNLSKLFYDGRFPQLRELNLSQNAFPSRFIRNFSSCFSELRLQHIIHLDVEDNGMECEDMIRFLYCLSHINHLESLNISRNLCDAGALRILAELCSNAKMEKLHTLKCSGITRDSRALASLFESFLDKKMLALHNLDISGNPIHEDDALVLAKTFFENCLPELENLDVSFTNLSKSGSFCVIARSWDGKFCTLENKNLPMKHLKRLNLAGNTLGESLKFLAEALSNRKLPRLEYLSLQDTGLGPLEFRLLADAFSIDSCPYLLALNISENHAGSEGISYFVPFLRSLAGRRVYDLDLNQNEIDSYGLLHLSEVLREGNCIQLQQLNISRNLELRHMPHYQQTIQMGVCPSLLSLQVKYAQTYGEGCALVREIKNKMSVEELRRRKNAIFEKKLQTIRNQNEVKAAKEHQRGKDKVAKLRKLYDHLESEADRALRRRKAIRKSTHLYIHQEIEQLKRNYKHEKMCKRLSAAYS